MSRIEAVVSDFGGVLTAPLMDAFAAFQDHSGIPLEALGKALQRAAEEDGVHPLFELECGRMSESAFLDRVGVALAVELGHEVEMHSFSEVYFANLHPNDELIDFMRTLRGRGLRMAICTNNVREWEPLWRAKLPVDEIFELVVDSAFEGVRKPDRAIYDIVVERVGLPASACLFIDDLEHNVTAAGELGFTAILHAENAATIAAIEAALG